MPDRAQILEAILAEDGSLQSIVVEQEDHTRRTLKVSSPTPDDGDTFYIGTDSHGPMSGADLTPLLESVYSDETPEWITRDNVTGHITLPPGSYNFHLNLTEDR